MSVGHLQEAPASRQFLMHPGTLWFLRLQRLGQEEALSAPSPALTQRGPRAVLVQVCKLNHSTLKLWVSREGKERG